MCLAEGQGGVRFDLLDDFGLLHPRCVGNVLDRRSHDMLRDLRNLDLLLRVDFGPRSLLDDVGLLHLRCVIDVLGMCVHGLLRDLLRLNFELYSLTTLLVSTPVRSQEWTLLQTYWSNGIGCTTI